MTSPRLLLCTDMDRTIIPNGKQPESVDARFQLAEFCHRPEVKLVYVTGRHQALVQQAIDQYGLPDPDFVITDVGTKIYRVGSGEWLEWSSWEKEIDRDWNGCSHSMLRDLLQDVEALRLQEGTKQNTHKLSYYLSLAVDKEVILREVDQRLKQKGVRASLVWSIDEAEAIGLLDVLPMNATKLHAIEFLQQQLGYERHEVVFSGDSGNDLPVLVSGVRSVLVANADEALKREAAALAEDKGNSNSLYQAKPIDGANGNYASGILQGIWYFVPGFRGTLESIGVSPSEMPE
ncbi:MAG: HAD-IIB family hydrolase [Thiohalomonadales bacterium]|nr:HAD-IIB family hydrolase [Thiohalomonadales bacterium]